MNGREHAGIRAHGSILAAITMLCALPLVAAYQPRLPGLPALRTSVAASPAHSHAPHAEASRRALGFREAHMKEEEPTSDDASLLLSAAVVGGLLGLQLTGACARSRQRLSDPNPHPAVRWHRRPSPSPANVHHVPTPRSHPDQVISSPRYSFLPSSCSAPPESSQTSRLLRRRARRPHRRRRRRRRRRQRGPPAG